MVRRLAVILLVTAACAAPAATPPATAASRPSTGRPAATAGPTASAAPAFLSHSFTDVRDGTRFRLDEFRGKTVLVIGMAVW